VEDFPQPLEESVLSFKSANKNLKKRIFLKSSIWYVNKT